jgi:hypothetical protein
MAPPEEEYTKDFPIFIRSKTLRGEPICDVQQLGLLPKTLKENISKIQSYFKYADEYKVLPGCATAYDTLKVTREFIEKIM